MPTPRGLVTWKPIGFLSILSFLNSCSYLTLQSPCQIFTDRALLTADYMTLAKDFEKGCCCDCCWCSSKVTREWRVLWHLRQYSTVVVWGLFAWRLIMAKTMPDRNILEDSYQLVKHFLDFKVAAATAVGAVPRSHGGVESTLAPPTILHSGCMGLVCLATDNSDVTLTQTDGRWR